MSKYFSDPRLFQILFLSGFLAFGLCILKWNISILSITVTFMVCFASQFFAARYYNLEYSSLLSATISSLGLILLLRANNLETYALASFLAISSKFIFRYKKVHFFNPVNFAIIATILISGDAWLSPGQWGSASNYILIVGVFSWMVLKRVKQLYTSLVFLGILFTCEFLYLNIHLGWPIDYVMHKFTSGALLLFSFFMITDPRTTPQNNIVRSIWAGCIAVISFYLIEFHYLSAAPFWVLFFVSPLTPIINSLTKYKQFNWITFTNSKTQTS